MAASKEAPPWLRGPLLGCGAFGSVNLALLRSSGELFAVKSVDADRSPDHLSALENELMILKSIKSQRVVRCVGADWTTENGVRRRNLHMEHVAGGSLSDLIKGFGGRLEEGLVRVYAKGLLEALREVHGEGVAHCDVKGKNILIGRGGEVKLCDFGASERVREWREGGEKEGGGREGGREGGRKEVEGGEWKDGGEEEGCASGSGGGGAANEGTATAGSSSRRLKGTICWMAPEVVQKAQQGTAGDIWSVGCTVIEMLTGKTPWGGQVSDACSALYRLGCTNEVPEIPSGISTKLREFLLMCLQRDPTKRPSAEVLLEHPFLASSPSGEFTENSENTEKCGSGITENLSCGKMSDEEEERRWREWEVTESTMSESSFGEKPWLAFPRRSKSEYAVPVSAATRGDLSLGATPSLSSFSSFHRLTAVCSSRVSQNTTPGIRLDMDLMDADVAPPDAEVGSSYWSSPGSPNAAQGRWLTVHSTSSSRNSSPPLSPSLSPPVSPSTRFFDVSSDSFQSFHSFETLAFPSGEPTEDERRSFPDVSAPSRGGKNGECGSEGAERAGAKRRGRGEEREVEVERKRINETGADDGRRRLMRMESSGIFSFKGFLS